MDRKPGPPTVAELFREPALLDTLTIPQLNGVAEQIELLKRLNAHKELVPESVIDFAVKFSAGRFKASKWHRYLGSFLNQLDKGGPSLLLSAPPRHGKSWTVSRWLPTWFLARNPSKRVILASYEATFAETWGRMVRNGIREFGADIGLQLDETSAAASRFDLLSGGGMMTAGAGGPILGKGADLFIIDDPIKNAQDASSQLFRDRLWDWFLTVVISRMEPGCRIVVMAQRWHEDDLHGRILREMERNPDFMKFEDVRLSALAEENDPIGREVGDPLWPERISKEFLLQRKNTMTPYYWSAMYQQHPTPEEGNLFQRKWWQFYQVPPEEFDQEILSWDLAFSTKSGADYTVGIHMARKGTAIYLLSLVRDRLAPADSMQAIKNMALRCPKAAAKLIERTGSSETHYALLQKDIPGLIPISPGSTSKRGRASMVVPYCEAGNVFLPQNAFWVDEFIEELAQFDNGTHDDQVDAFVQGLAYLMLGAQAFRSAEQRRLRQSVQPPKTPEEMQQRQFSAFYQRVMKRVDRKWRRSQRTGIPIADL